MSENGNNGNSKPRKRKYSENTKASVLANLDANNGNAAKTARESGVPRTTIESWKDGIGLNEDVANIRHVKKEDLRDLHKYIAVKALGLLKSKMSECSGQQLSTIGAISTEKMLLLDGDATSITKDATPRANEDRADKLMGVLSLVKKTA